MNDPAVNGDIVSSGVLQAVRLEDETAFIALAIDTHAPEQVHKVVADIHSALAGFLGLRHVRVEIVGSLGVPPAGDNRNGIEP